jgi:predicted Fe-S protein YdhL (DUF1289 family)
MPIGQRTSPCIGICSTTYGDLVCRGCRRFAHEVASWNAYTEAQRERVWQRLGSLRDAATAALVEVIDDARLRAAAARFNVSDVTNSYAVAYEVLRRSVRLESDLAATGLRARGSESSDPRTLRDAIDAEFHLRSVAAYEHSFHVPVDR